MLRFDDLGLGDSEGDWGEGSSTDKVSDTVFAAAFSQERGTPADLLVGHSSGGAAVLAERAAQLLVGGRALTPRAGLRRGRPPG